MDTDEQLASSNSSSSSVMQLNILTYEYLCMYMCRKGEKMIATECDCRDRSWWLFVCCLFVVDDDDERSSTTYTTT